MSDSNQANPERRRNLAVGATALLGMVGLAVLLTAFGYTPGFLRSGYEVTLYLDDAAGLHNNSRVTLSGLDIGQVQRIELNTDPGQPGKAHATLLIREGVAIPGSATVRIETPLFGGGPVVALVEPDDAPIADALAIDGSATLAAAKIIDPLVQLEVVSTDIGELKDTWVDVGNNLNRLLANTDDPTAPSLPRVVLNLEQRLDQFNEVLAGVDQWVNNPQLRDDITQTAANLHELSEQLGSAVANLETRYADLADAAEATLANADGMLLGADRSVESIERRYVVLADDATATLAAIDALLVKADSDDSTLGLILNDPQLYQNLNDSAERLQLMIDEARLLVEKWKAEGVPLRVFQ